MPLWVFRASVIIGLPLLAYIFTGQNENSALLGLIVALIILATEYFLKSLKVMTIMIGIFGALAGYLVYMCCDYAILKLMQNPTYDDLFSFWKEDNNAYRIAFSSVYTMLGVLFAILHTSELEGLSRKGRHIKIVDMSALIDGRIVDLCDTGFLTGTIVLPKFILNKLSVLASSKDPLEKAKGRRGLDIVSRLQELKGVPVKITSKEVEGKNTAQCVVKLARSFKAEVVTVDFNVNKEAVLIDVPVLNICDLTNALKPVVLPGENMSIFIMKEGKDSSQGIGYLDDGTMVVVEDGRKQIGHRAEVSVYSILQTSAGRMIFARLKA